MPETAAMKQEGIHQDLQENKWTGDREVNCEFYRFVVKDRGLDFVPGSAHSEKEEESTSTISMR
jgi:hypothetical protein